MRSYARSIISLLIVIVITTLSGCGPLSSSTPAPLPTIVLENTGSTAAPASAGAIAGGISASGVVAPPQEALLAFAQAGIVDRVSVAVGDVVEAGQVLARLAGSEKLGAAVEVANLDLLAAQQELLLAQRARQDLDRNLPLAQTDALQTLNEARQAVKDAESKVAGLSVQASQADLDEAQATLILAKDRLEKANKDYKEVENRGENNLTRAALLNRKAQAQRDYDNAARRYNNLMGGSTEFYRRQTMAEMAIAQARLELAQDDFDILKEGPKPEDVAQADKRIETAQGRIAAAEASIQSVLAGLADLELKAPFAGTVARVNIFTGEWAIPGQPILLLADLEHLLVKTTDLSERDISSVQIGQKVTVFVKALQQEITGSVTAISPLADTIGGDVVYQTTIKLENPPEDLRAGMSVDVRFGT